MVIWDCRILISVLWTDKAFLAMDFLWPPTPSPLQREKVYLIGLPQATDGDNEVSDKASCHSLE